MLDHVSITVTNIGAAEKFYDAIMSALGVPKLRNPKCGLDTASGPMVTIQTGITW